MFDLFVSSETYLDRYADSLKRKRYGSFPSPMPWKVISVSFGSNSLRLTEQYVADTSKETMKTV